MTELMTDDGSSLFLSLVSDSMRPRTKGREVAEMWRRTAESGRRAEKWRRHHKKNARERFVVGGVGGLNGNGY